MDVRLVCDIIDSAETVVSCPPICPKTNTPVILERRCNVE